MGATIPVGIMGYQGQGIQDIRVDEAAGKVSIPCNRDRRRKPVDPRSGRAGSLHRHKRRTIRDVPLAGYACEVEIEYAETFLSPASIHGEALPFVAPKARVTRRYARLISGLCRPMPPSSSTAFTSCGCSAT